MGRRAPFVLSGMLFLLGVSVAQDAVRTKAQGPPAVAPDLALSRVALTNKRPRHSPAETTQARANYQRLPLSFEPNQGQAGSDVQYLARGGHFNVFLTHDEVVFSFARRSARRQLFDNADGDSEPPALSSIELRLQGASPTAAVSGVEALLGKANYLVGRDPKQWHLDLPTFAKVRYRNVYPGIDLLYYGNQGELESDFIIAPGANPEAVKLSVAGAEGMTIDASGDLILRMKDGALRLRKPLVYQESGSSRQQIAGNYVLAGQNQVGFRVAQYDRSRPLVIDPVLSYSTYLGGNGVDEATAIAVDSAGNAYITGDTTSTNFPVTGAPATGDMFVAKLDPNGAKVYATYVGGAAQLDFPTGIGVDVLGNAYIVGQTGETNLPTTAGALRTAYQGGTFDGFVFSLNAAGTGFNYFTYLGGSAFDLLTAVAVDSLGNAYITGQTDSGDYPILNPFETLATAGDGGIFITTNSGTNWNASATGLVNRNITVVAVDPKTPTTIYAATLESGVIKSTNSGGVWSAINTGLTSLVIQALVVDPVTPANVYVGTGRGGVFVSHNGGTSWATMNAGLVGINVHALAIDPTSPGTLYASTGGNGVFKFTGSAWSPTGALPQDVATAIVVDPTNDQNVYVSFQNSGVYRSSNGGTSWTAFNTGLSSLQAAALAIDHGGHLYAGTRTGGVFLSTGGGSWTTINTGLSSSVFQALATDPTNNTTVYVGTFNGGVFRSTNNGASWSEATNDGLNTTRVSSLAVDPVTPTNLYAGSQMVEGVVTKLSPGGGLVFSSYLGGGGGEAGLGIAVDGDNGNLYVAGFTNSLNFPTVASAQATMNGGISGFVSKVKSDGSGLTYSTYLGGSGNQDQAIAIAADSAGNAYVTGLTNSTDFPTLNPIQAALAGTSNAFVAKYNASGQKLFATYLGGEAADAGNAITVTANTDGSTSAWIAGQTTSQFFPVANPIQLSRNGGSGGSNAGFISDFNFPASGAAPTVVFSTFLGTGCGSSGCDTIAQAIGHDGTNNIYVAGRTMSNGFPVVNAVQSTLAGTQNAFIAKIGATTNNADLSLTLNSFGPTTVVAGATVNFSLTVTNHGPNDAPNVALGGRGGAKLAIITCTATQGICGDNLQVLDKGFAELGTLASGASATVTGVLRPLTACGGAGVLACPFTIVVDARSDANDPNPANNSVSTNLTVLAGADLAVTLSASPSPAPVQVGGTLNYIANLSNLGPSNASNVTAVFTLAPATAATFVSLPPGCTNSAPGTLTCLLGPMPAGTAGLDSIPVTVNSLPITAEIVVSNTPEADPDPTNNVASVTTTTSASGVNNAELNGQYAFLARGFDSSGQAIAIGGSFTADGAGHITGGVKDVNVQNSGVTADASIIAASSSYSVGADNRGQLTLTTASSTHNFDFSLGSISSGVASLGHIISRQNASATNGSAISGVFKKQDPTAFALAAINGDWAFLNEGVDGSGKRFANAGRFTLSAGNITNGSEDFNDNGVFDNGTTTALTITGSLGSVDANGRVPLTAGSGTPGHTAVYIVSANEALTMSIDPISANPLASGSALRQSTTFCPTTGGCNFANSALNGNAVIYTQGNSSSGVAGASDVNVGVLTFNLATTSFIGTLDENDGGTIYCPAADLCANPGGSTASGSYSVASNGRVTLTLGSGENNPPFFYMVNTNQAFLIGSSSGHVNAGVAENQVGPIANNSFSSAFGTEPPAVSGSLMFSGVLTATAINSTNSSLTGTTDDINSVGPITDVTGGGLHEDVSVEDDTTTLDPATGRFTFASGTKVGYFINSSRLVTIDVEPTNTAPYIIISDNQSSGSGAQPDLAVGITANPSTGVFVGGPITYTVTVSGKNSTPATGVVLATVLSPSLTVNSVTPSQGTCTVPSLPASIAGFPCSLGTISQSAPVTVAIVALAPANGLPCAGSSLGCIAAGASATENEIEFNPADNTATVITPILQASTTTCTGTTTNWLGGTGNWSDSTKWSTGVVPNSSSVNVCIDNGNPVASQVTLDISASVGNLTVDANDSLIVGNNTSLVVSGNISNSGQISVNAAGNNTFLQIAGGRNVSLSGGGSLTLSTSGNGTAIINQTSGGATLTNVDNTIQGRGQIGNNGLALANQAAGTIKANVAATLLLNPNGITNAGTMAATTGGTLQTTTTVNNAGGTISSAGSGSAVQFLNGTTVQGGTLNGSAGGVLGTAASNTATLDGTTQGALTNAGTYTGANNSATVLRGTITNTGAIQVTAAGNNTFLQVAGGQNTSLAGGGTLTLSTSGNGAAIVNQTSGGSTLTNVDNTIQGQGEIGNNGLALVNQAGGTINANAGTLTVDAAAVTNQHLMEATSGGTLAVNSTTVNNNASTILANGGTVQFTATTIQGGTLNTLNGGVLGTAPSQTVTLDGSPAHQGTLNNTGTYTAPNNSATILLGAINNSGAILLSAVGNTTQLQIAGGQTTTLTGAGTVTMSTSGNGTPIINQTSGGGVLNNADNTIQGQGDIGNNGLALINSGTINANVSGKTLTIDAAAPTNAGTFEATAGGILALSASTINNKSGIISADAAGSTVQFVNGVTLQSGTLSATNGGLLGTAASTSATLDGSTLGQQITLSGTYTAANNSSTILAGTINNTGSFLLSAAGSTTLLQIRGGQNVTLTGGGTVTMSTSGNGTPIINQTSGGSTLTNVNNLIQGQGEIGNNGLKLVNQAIINANVPGRTLTIDALTPTNSGTLQATGGGSLALNNSVVTNQGGTITVDGATSAVQFVNAATIQGGTLTTTNGGLLGTAASTTITLDGSTHGTLTNAGVFVGANNSSTILVGTINNTGAIQISAAGNTTLLQVTGGQNVTLTGGGTVTLSTSGNGTPIINQTSGGSTLTNVNNLIQGQGQIGNNGLALVNQAGGTVNANAGGALLINTASVTNQHLMEATGGGTLQVNTTVIGLGGAIAGSGAGSSVQFLSGANLQGGTLSTSGGAAMGTAASNSVTLDGSTANGAVVNTGTYTAANNSTTVVRGTINNTGAILVSAAGNTTLLQVAGGQNTTLTGSGTVTLSTSGNGTAIINQSSGGSALTNAGNTIQGQGQIGNNGLSVVNQGAITANLSGVVSYSQTAGSTVIAAATTASVTSFAISGGTARVDGTLNAPSGVSVTGTGTLSGTGSINGAVSMAGVIQPGDGASPGTLTVASGGYTQTSAGALGILIGGATLGTQFSQLTVSGAAGLNGTLNVSLINGFSPVVGNSFTILTSTAISGTFGNVGLPSLSGGSWQLTYNPASVVLSVVSQGPSLTSLSPSSTLAGGSGFTLTVNGTNFVSGSSVSFNGNPRTTTFVSATQLTVAILAADIATAGAFNVTVTNPAPGGISNALTFTVNNPAPTIASLSPSSASVGSAAFTLTVNGANFVTTSTVNFNGSARTTTFVSATQLTAAILASDIATAGSFNVTVTNPAPGGGTSNAFTFTVNNPSPAITSLSPSSVIAGSGGFTLTVNGTGFVNTSAVDFNGSGRATTFVSATQLTATILASDVTTPGNFNITVVNPTPGGGLSAPATFVVIAPNPVPAITTLSPSGVLVGGPAFTLTVNGTGFLSNSAVNFGGNARTTTFVSATQLTAAILAADITTAGSVNVTVTNPAPGGGTSNAAPFAINPVADLAVGMTASAPTVPVFGSVTYQITVTNNGPNPASGVTLTDILPANTVFASIDDLTDCAVSSGTLHCNFGTLAVGSGAAKVVNLILVPLAVPAETGTFDNTATVTANEFDPTPSNNTSTQTVQVTGTNLPGGGAFRTLPGLSANILPGNDDDSAGPVPMNLNLNFFGLQVSTAFVNNNGNVTFNSALGDFTPFPLTSTSVPIIAPFFADVETDFPTSGQVTYGNDTVNARPAFGVNWPGVEYCCGSDPTKHNLFQLLLVDRSDVGAGDFDIEFNYDQIQWETGGASGGTGGLGGSSARVGYSNGSQTAGSFFELPGSGVPGSFLDTNTTSGLIFNSLNSTQPGRYVFQVRGGTVQSSADLAIGASGPQSATAGSTITYTLTATNLGPNAATGVTVTNTLPAGFSFVSAAPTGICSTAGQPVVVTCNVESLANGSNAIITIQAAIPLGLSGSATDIAVVSVPNNQDLNLGNNTATVLTNVAILPAVLSITKTHSGNFAQGQSGAAYTITVSNAAGAGATNGAVTMIDTVPSGLTATAINGAGWTCPSLTSCNRADSLAAGASYPPITLTADVAFNAPASVTNTATVSGGGAVNPASANDVATILPAAADLVPVIAIVPPPDASGTTISYAITVTNNGPSSATQVQLTNQLVGNAGFVSASSPTMTCPAPAANSLACTVAVLNNGASALVNVTVNLMGPGWDSNTVQVSSQVPDSNPGNNVASVQKVSAGGNTVTGSEVAVQPVDSTTGASPAILTFASVTRGGTTTVSSAASGPTPPAGFRTGTPAVVYNLSTTAGYSGAVSVALGFNGVSFHHPANVRLFHYENGAWIDRTVAINPAGGYILAQVTSLSPFALFEPINHAPDAKVGPDLTTTATGAQGAKVTLNGSASIDADHDPLTYRWTGPFPEGNGVATGVSPTVTMPAGANTVTLVVNDGEADSKPAQQVITVTDFSVAAAAAGPTTISAGGSVKFNVTASQQFGPFASAVALACLGLPQGTQCSFSPNSVNAGGAAATLTITTTPRTSALLAPAHHTDRAPLYALWMPLPGIVMLGLGARRRSRKRTAALMLLLLIGMMLLLVSCGGGGMGVTPQPQQFSTPAGTYTVTVMGTASGTLQHTTTVTFTVQ